MPRKPTSGCKPLYVEMPLEMDSGLRELAARNGRGVKDELLHAVRRHLATPPTLVAPELPPDKVVPPADDAPKRGRPRKKGPTP